MTLDPYLRFKESPFAIGIPVGEGGSNNSGILSCLRGMF